MTMQLSKNFKGKRLLESMFANEQICDQDTAQEVYEINAIFGEYLIQTFALSSTGWEKSMQRKVRISALFSFPFRYYLLYLC